jgi:hypothetical protein
VFSEPVYNCKDPGLKADVAAKTRYLRPTEEIKQRVRGGSAGSRCLMRVKRLTVSCIRYTVYGRATGVSGQHSAGIGQSELA